jgi:hypothetical protein
MLTNELRQIGPQTVHMNGDFPWLVHWAYLAGPRDFCSALAALAGPVKKNVFLTIHFFNSYVPIALQAVQAVVPGSLSIHVCLWVTHMISLCNPLIHALNLTLTKTDCI